MQYVQMRAGDVAAVTRSWAHLVAELGLVAAEKQLACRPSCTSSKHPVGDMAHQIMQTNA
jgi:hypothetical protein